MGVGYERMMELQEKSDRIIRGLIELTKSHQIFWEKVPAAQRTYRTEHKDMSIELRDCGYTLEIDSHVITTKEASASLLEELDCEIQGKLDPLGPRFTGRVFSITEHIDEILGRLKA